MTMRWLCLVSVSVCLGVVVTLDCKVCQEIQTDDKEKNIEMIKFEPQVKCVNATMTTCPANSTECFAARVTAKVDIKSAFNESYVFDTLVGACGFNGNATHNFTTDNQICKQLIRNGIWYELYDSEVVGHRMNMTVRECTLRDEDLSKGLNGAVSVGWSLILLGTAAFYQLQ